MVNLIIVSDFDAIKMVVQDEESLSLKKEIKEEGRERDGGRAGERQEKREERGSE